MTQQHQDPKNFIPLFVLVTVVDLLTRVAVASGDEVFEHLAMLWLGPLDDVFYGLIGIQAFLYLLDPSGSKTIDEKGGYNHQRILAAFKTGSEKVFAKNYVRGSKYTFSVLTALLAVFLVITSFVSNPLLKGAVMFLQQHLSLTFPVSVALVTGIAFFRLTEHTSAYWKSALAAGACLFLAAALDGRWQNHLYHLVSNLENLMAWTVAMSWAGFIAAQTEGQAASE